MRILTSFFTSIRMVTSFDSGITFTTLPKMPPLVITRSSFFKARSNASRYFCSRCCGRSTKKKNSRPIITSGISMLPMAPPGGAGCGAAGCWANKLASEASGMT